MSAIPKYHPKGCSNHIVIDPKFVRLSRLSYDSVLLSSSSVLYTINYDHRYREP